MGTIRDLETCYCNLKKQVDQLELSGGSNQFLSIEGDMLSISDGNTVSIGIDSQTDVFDIAGTLRGQA